MSDDHEYTRLFIDKFANFCFQAIVSLIAFTMVVFVFIACVWFIGSVLCYW